jgi:type VI secretion system VasD/TssJ family lipoprotein
MPANCLRSLLWAVFPAAIIGSCSHTPPPAASAAAPCPEPEALRLQVRAGDRLNPGEKSEPLATVVRVYQLKDAGKLTEAGFEEMLDRPKEVLGEELVEAKELTINPSERLQPAFARAAGASYLGVVALFRQPSGTSWRALARLPQADPHHCHPDTRGQKRGSPVLQVVLDENRVEIR